MTDIFDVARYILHKKGYMSIWKLEKLCYYAQSYSLAWTGNPLFEEDFEAWENGPVCRTLYETHKKEFSVCEWHLPKGNIRLLNDKQKEIIDDALRDYGWMAPSALTDLVCSEEPWCDARGNLTENAGCNAVISKTAMGHFSRRARKNTTDVLEPVAVPA